MQEAKRQKRLEELRDAKRRAKEPSVSAVNADTDAAAGTAGAEGSAEGKGLDGMTVTEVLYVFVIAWKVSPLIPAYIRYPDQVYLLVYLLPWRCGKLLINFPPISQICGLMMYRVGWYLRFLIRTSTLQIELFPPQAVGFSCEIYFLFKCLHGVLIIHMPHAFTFTFRWSSDCG